MRIEMGNYVDEIKKLKPKKILLQLPEGLKIHVFEITSEIEKKIGAEVIISGEPCYGACDLRIDEAKLLDCDLILHFGHADFGIKSEIPVIYVPTKVDFKITIDLKNKLKNIKENKIGIYSSEPYKKALDELEIYLKEIGKEIIEKKIILGCSEIEQRGEANIFVGSGKFHCFALRGNTYFLDLEKGELRDVSALIRREEMKKQAKLTKFKEAKKVGVLLSKKPGQFYRDYKKLKEKLEKDGKKVEVFIFDEITDEKLLGLGYDFYINTACPRILDSFSLPLVNLRNLKE